MIAGKPALPAKLRIGHVTYQVTADPAKCDLTDAEGLSAGPTAEIIVRGDRPPDLAAETLLHEVIHQCLFVAGMDCTLLGGDGPKGRDLEELIVRAMAGPLTGALRDNPSLVAYLLAT